MSSLSFLKKYSPRQWALLVSLVLVVGVSVFYLLQSARAVTEAPGRIDPAYSSYVATYTSGVISSRTPLKFRFTSAVADSSRIGKEADSRLAQISPSVPGKLRWLDGRTLEFTPEKKWASGSAYKVKVHLHKIMEVPSALSTFEYSFQTLAQNFDVDIVNLATPSAQQLGVQQLEGVLSTADFAEEAEVQQVVKAYQNGKELPMEWAHANEGRTHTFMVNQVSRGNQPGEVVLQMNGKPLGVSRESRQQVEVPALGDFKVMAVRVVQSPSQHVVVQFSDPLMSNQELEGLIQLPGAGTLTYTVRQNLVLVYPSARQTGNLTLRIEAGIRNIQDKKLPESLNWPVIFEQVAPGVRFTGKGTILPGTDGLVLPFEAVNLKSVDVDITRIFENNIAQFFQVNSLDGNYELRRVGRSVYTGTLSLQAAGVTDLSKWNRFTIDLSSLIQAEPGAIYQVKITFKKDYAYFACGADTQEEVEQEFYDEWEYYDEEYYDYDYYYPPGYDWRQRDNPCHISYYNYSRFIKKNVLASDLGLIAKRGNDGKMRVAVTDLGTARPIQGVKVDVLDYQQQVLATATTNAEGWAFPETTEKPFLVVAHHQQQRGYLKMDDGSSLSLSNFNVGGTVVQKGFKGLIYGDRGVWRPGDTLHLSFMLEDKLQTLPATHPVVLELVNPLGQLEHRQVRNTSVGGIYYFPVATSTEAPTGNWTARVKVGGAEFTQRVKIETIKPNRLKINLDFGADAWTGPYALATGKLNVAWLHGAPARNLKAEFDMVLSPTVTRFTNYENYVFDDPARRFEAESERVFEGRLDANGQARVQVNLPDASHAPGALMAYFTGKVYEEGGNFSIDKFSVPYYPFRSFVGIRAPKGASYSGRLDLGKNHTVDLVNVNAAGQPVNGKLEVTVYKVNWRWWWDNSDEYLSYYVTGNHHQAVGRTVVNTAQGKGSFTLNQPEWGRYLVRACDTSSGHCTGKVLYLDYGYGAPRGTDRPEGATLLSVSADKDEYQTGDKVKLSIPGSSRGRALVSVENGSRVVQQWWVETRQGENTFEFAVTPEMAPNVYVHVTLLQEHNQTENDLPIRLYGIVPLLVVHPATRLEPLIQMPDVLAPEKEVVIKVSEKSKRKMAYSVAVVDEGLLDITRFKTPTPWNVFYAREALGVKTWDMYDHVMGAFGGNLERLLALGGDDLLGVKESAKANRFKPVVKYLGPFILEPGKTNTHKFTMPAYVGSVRTMVVAGYEGAYGQAEATTPVKQPLMVLATLPRVLGPDEELQLPVTVFVEEKNLSQVKVDLKTNELLTVVGAATQTVSFSQPGDQVVYFRVKVKSTTGVARATVTTQSGSATARHELEVDVRNPNPPQTKVTEAIVEAGKSWNVDLHPIGMAGTNHTVLEVSNMPPINLENRLGYLIRYPHGCIEQTVSAVFPQLYLEEFTPLSEQEKMQIEVRVKAAIERLKTFQLTSGGFAYWPGSTDADNWGSSYAGHFLVEAEAKGYTLPDGMLRQWKRYQRSTSTEWRKREDQTRSDLQQAYRLYTLALAGAAETGAMNRMREQGDLSLQAAWRLAAAYARAGQPEAARKLIETLTTTVSPYKELSYSYGSDMRDKAMIVETLLLLNEKTKAVPLVKELAEALGNERYWMSTQTTAYALLAMSQWVGKEEKSGKVKYTWKWEGGKAIQVETALPVARSPAMNAQGGIGKMEFKNESAGVLFVRVIQTGIPTRGQETSEENNLKVNVQYTTLSGEPMRPESIRQGTDFVAEVTVAHPGIGGEYKELALTQIFPSGWEILNARMEEVERVKSDTPSYQDIRDDRVYTYFNLRPGQRLTFRLLLNASYEGSYYLPAVSCEAMYDNTIYARVAGMDVKVVK
jgi:alpha-2-macroglobulin